MMTHDDTFYWLLWIATLAVVATIMGTMMGCAIPPRQGVVLDPPTGTYKKVMCDAYKRTPIDRAILLCESVPNEAP
jgi:hypothetical protein